MVDNDFITRLYNQVQYQIANGIPVEDSQSDYLYIHGITVDFVNPPSVIGIPDDEDSSPMFGSKALTGAKEHFQSWKRTTGMNRIELKGIKKNKIIKL
jgi:hypothetical protein